MIPPLESQHSGNQDVELFQQNVKKFAKVLEDNPLLDGRLIEDVDLVVGATNISHRLGRTPRGWFFTRVRGLAAAAPVVDEGAVDGNFLTLVSDTAFNVSLWVF